MVKPKLASEPLLRTGYPVEGNLKNRATEGRRPERNKRPVGRRLSVRLAARGGCPARPSLRSARKPLAAGADAPDAALTHDGRVA